ncbi:alpha/beta hydrolase [Cellvibrio fibrivorans]|uniref:S-formylglutathione hydrolase FrmB n=1 Tax=Cellvibrio fibrivorans TaxID=126350 RepID=A0ABU1UVN0_9GAMM|nr:alpha/beta hydrolase-fold protein [Cellvibrio fibrivorans]MDR7089237.1 S-formylglutathione hydrolase FrmB [Cellvibrio fibrivorans]
MAVIRIEQSNPEYLAEHFQLLTVQSSHLNRRCDISVFNAHPDSKDLPIVILLHGVYGNHWVWSGLGGVHKAYSDEYAKGGLSQMILVMPSDGGFYGGSAYLPLANGENYEKWIVEDVIAAVIKCNPSASLASNVYIAGLSMGGYGALRLGAKFPTIFKGISAHSSITDIREMAQFVAEDLSLYNTHLTYESDIVHWLQVNKNHLPPIRFDCGTEDTLYSGNQRFNQRLQQLGITAELESLSGEHSWDYWNRNVRKTFDFFSQIQELNYQ